jgi:protein-S-isoprenylcysteine O-methyltransferase Ste14
MKTLFTALRATLFGTGFIFFWRWIALTLRDRYDARCPIAFPAWTPAVGIGVMAAGGSLAFACVAMFVARGQGTPAPFDPPRKFVAAGPYKFVRNPMYVGGFTTLVGFGLHEKSPAILLFTVPFLLFAHLFVVTYEEPHLRAKFGETYDGYCRSVRRWLPGLFPVA